MLKSIFVASCLLLSHQAAAQDYLPTANIQLHFGGSKPTDLHLRLAASRFTSINGTLEPLPIVAAHFDWRGASFASLLGVPLTAATFRVNLDEAQAASGYSWWWIGAGVAVAAVAAVVATNDDDSGGNDNNVNNNNDELGVNRCVIGGADILIPPPICTPND